MNCSGIDDGYIHRNNTLILSQWPVQPRYVPENHSDNSTADKTKEEPVNDSHKCLLMEVYQSQYHMTLTAICKAAGFPAGTGSRIAEECIKRNLMKVIQVPFGRGRPKYPVLLPEGYALLGVQEKTSCGRGAGHEHTLYQQLIAQHFHEFKPTIELNRNGKFIDVAIETNECLICIEVAMTAVHEKENIEKDVSCAKAHAVVITCLTEKVRGEVQESIHDIHNEIKQRVTIMLIPELLKMKSEEFLNTLQPHLC